MKSREKHRWEGNRPKTLSTNKGRFCNNSEVDTLILKRLSVENKAKLSQLEIVNMQYCGGGVLSVQLREFRFVLYRYHFEISVLITLVLQNLPLLMKFAWDLWVKFACPS